MPRLQCSIERGSLAEIDTSDLAESASPTYDSPLLLSSIRKKTRELLARLMCSTSQDNRQRSFEHLRFFILQSLVTLVRIPVNLK